MFYLLKSSSSIILNSSKNAFVLTISSKSHNSDNKSDDNAINAILILR